MRNQAKDKRPVLRFTAKELDVIYSLVSRVDLLCDDTQFYLSCRRISKKVSKELVNVWGK